LIKNMNTFGVLVHGIHHTLLITFTILTSRSMVFLAFRKEEIDYGMKSVTVSSVVTLSNVITMI